MTKRHGLILEVACSYGRLRFATRNHHPVKLKESRLYKTSCRDVAELEQTWYSAANVAMLRHEQFVCELAA